MAERLSPGTQQFRRDLIVRSFPDRDAQIRFERMVRDLAENIPGVVNSHAEDVEQLRADVDDLQARVDELEQEDGNRGVAVIDFGAEASHMASVVVTGQDAITAEDTATAWFVQEASEDQGADAHAMAAALISLSAGSVTPGVGFTITALCQSGATGRFNVRWHWS